MFKNAVKFTNKLKINKAKKFQKETKRSFGMSLISQSDKMTSKQIIERELKYSAHNYHPLEFVWERAKGVKVWDPEGREYIDFLAAYSAANQGHCHPRLIKAMTDQAGKLDIPSRAFFNNKFGEYAEFVTKYFGYESVLPMNSGAEGVEAALKLARKWGYLKKKIPKNEGIIISFTENFHGRTITVISMSTDPSAYNEFGPLTPGFHKIPFNDIKAFQDYMQKNGEKVIGALIEPIQGEAGIKIPDSGYLKSIHKICKENNALLIADEIQTGIGRTGKMLACDYEDVKPDILILGKALSGGMFPVSCILSKWEIMECIKAGQHGSTYGGHPIGCAVAIEALKILKDENLVENSKKMGEYFRENLKSTLKSEYVKEMRGRGLMNAIEVYPNLPKTAWDICIKLGENGLLCKPTHDHIIRMTPPLCITQQEMDHSLEIIQKVFKSL